MDIPVRSVENRNGVATGCGKVKSTSLYWPRMNAVTARVRQQCTAIMAESFNNWAITVPHREGKKMLLANDCDQRAEMAPVILIL